MVRVLLFISLYIFPAAAEDIDPNHFAIAQKAYEAGQYQTAFNHFLIDAENGNPEAQYEVAFFYEYGFVIEQDLDQARVWFEEAAKQNHPGAMLDLSIFYSDYYEDEVKFDYWFNKLKMLENSAAYYLLGQYFLKINEPLAREYFTKAAADSHPQAPYMLASLSDPEDAIRILMPLAETGEARAQYELAELKMYEDDKAPAFALYEKAANAGYIPALERLVYSNVFDPSLPDNLPLAVRWADKATEYGSKKVYFYLGRHYEQKGDFEKAFEYYKKATQQNHTSSYADIGRLFEQGKITTKDFDEALKWFLKGAKVGDPNSFTGHARLYSSSGHKNLDYAETLKWVLLAQYIAPPINYGDFHNIYDPYESFANEIKSHLTEKQINEVSKRKEEWLKANPQVQQIYQVKNYKRWLETNRIDF